MAVYVDELLQWPKSPKWPYGQSCHMYADTVEELHEFAATLGLKRSWFQQHEVMPHYDLTKTKRALAVRRGAVEHSRGDVVEVIRQRREEKAIRHKAR